MARTILTDQEWSIIEALLPIPKDKRGRPAREHRQVVEGILWVLRTGAPWRDLPKELCPWQTAYTRFSRWTKSGVWASIWHSLKKTPMRNTNYTMQV